jgi:hypothetical protein
MSLATFKVEAIEAVRRTKSWPEEPSVASLEQIAARLIQHMLFLDVLSLAPAKTKDNWDYSYLTWTTSAVEVQKREKKISLVI